MSGALITKMTVYGYPDVLCVTCMQSQRKAHQITSEQGTSRERLINGTSCSSSSRIWGAEGSGSKPLFPVGIGYHPSSVWAGGPLPQKSCLCHRDSPGGSWKAAGECSSATKCLKSSHKGKFSATVLERGSLAHLREGGLEGERRVSLLKKYVLVLRRFLNVIGQAQLPRRLLLETLQAENETLLCQIPCMRIAAGSPAGPCVPAVRGALHNADFYFLSSLSNNGTEAWMARGNKCLRRLK